MGGAVGHPVIPSFRLGGLLFAQLFGIIADNSIAIRNPFRRLKFAAHNFFSIAA
jgi:hypothetical protein